MGERTYCVLMLSFLGCAPDVERASVVAKRLKMQRVVAVVTALALMPGCATIFHGTSETINVRSEVPETTFYAGGQEIGRGTSAVTTVQKKSLKKTTLRAEKADCITKTTPLMTSFDGISLLGILLDFGLIGACQRL